MTSLSSSHYEYQPINTAKGGVVNRLGRPLVIQSEGSCTASKSYVCKKILNLLRQYSLVRRLKRDMAKILKLFSRLQITSTLKNFNDDIRKPKTFNIYGFYRVPCKSCPSFPGLQLRLYVYTSWLCALGNLSNSNTQNVIFLI